MILTSPNERTEVKQALGDLYLSSDLPFDFLLLTARGSVAVERKQFPDDFIASVKDGRFSRECAAMREETEYRIIISEGHGSYTVNEKLRIGGRESEWTRQGVRNVRRSLRYVEGCDIEDTESIKDTARCLIELQNYFDTISHISMRSRPGFETAWAVPTYEERYIYWLQGCGPGIKARRARMIAKVYKTPFELMNATPQDLLQIDGIGKNMANSIYNFLRGTMSD